MKSAYVPAAALLIVAMSAEAWVGPTSNKSTAELERMSDAEVIAEALGPCTKANEYGSSATDCLFIVTELGSV